MVRDGVERAIERGDNLRMVVIGRLTKTSMTLSAFAVVIIALAIIATVSESGPLEANGSPPIIGTVRKESKLKRSSSEAARRLRQKIVLANGNIGPNNSSNNNHNNKSDTIGESLQVRESHQISADSGTMIKLNSSSTMANKRSNHLSSANNQTVSKRFKSSLSGNNQSINDINNNAANSEYLGIVTSHQSNDLNNNNTADSEANLRPQNWRRNVNSINGTIDLSEYGQSDVDRLYGDGLLVYFKNFNETLPARRELVSVNGTNSGGAPIYRSDPQSPRSSSRSRPA